MPQYLGILFALAVVAFFAIAITGAIRKQKQRIAEKTQILASLGFQVVHPPDPGFVERVVRLRTRWGREHYRVSFLAHRKSWEDEAYVFDLWRRSGKNTRLVGENSMAFVSSSLHLPRFSLIPRVELPKFVSGLVDSLTQKLLSKRGGRVEFPGNPPFAEEFIVAGEDHDAIRRLLSGQIVDFLTSHKNYQIEADGDMVMISAAQFGKKTSRPSPDSLHRTFSEATALFELLMGK